MRQGSKYCFHCYFGVRGTCPVLTHVFTCINTCINMFLHVYIYMYIMYLTYTCTCICKHICLYMYIYMYLRVYIYIHGASTRRLHIWSESQAQSIACHNLTKWTLFWSKYNDIFCFSVSTEIWKIPVLFEVCGRHAKFVCAT